MHIARTIRITGHVQGVFFREWAVKVASAIGVTGWVRNRSDGSVEVYAAGVAEQIERFVAELRLGSPASRVDAVEVSPAALESVSGFMRRASA
jgi:acylphosphatase